MRKDRAFCVNCGKESEKLIDGLCAECYSKKGGFSSVDTRLRMEMCSVCNSIKYRGNWLRDDIYSAMRRLIIDNLRLSPEIEWKRIDTEFYKKGKTLHGAVVRIYGKIGDSDVNESIETEILVNKTVCPKCSRKAGKYYEAIIQIRADGRDFDKGEKEAIESFLSESIKVLEDGGRGVFITDKKETRRGVDFYISDKRAAHSLIYQMRNRFGGEVKSSPKLFGVKDGIKQYRMTYLLRLHRYREQDFIVREEDIFYIKRYSPEGVKVINLRNWREHSFRHREIMNFKVLRREDFLREAIVVSKRGREVQILDPDTYKTLEAVIPEDVNLDKTVKMIKYKDEIFFIPPE